MRRASRYSWRWCRPTSSANAPASPLCAFRTSSTSGSCPGCSSSRCSAGAVRVGVSAMKGADPRAARVGGQARYGVAKRTFSGEDLAGVEQVVRVERSLQALLQRDHRLALLLAEEAALGQAHAVLPGDRAAQPDGGLDHLVDGGLAPSALVGAAEEQVHVQVAVAGVAVGGGGEPVLLADAADGADHLQQLTAGHGDVLADLERPDVGQRDPRHAPRFPQLAALRLVLGREHLQGPMRGAQLARPRQLLGRALPVAVVLDQERAADPLGELERRPRSQRAHGGTVEQLARARQEAGVEDGLHRAGRRVLVGEQGEQRLDPPRERDELQRRLGDHRQRPLAADQEVGQIVPRDSLPAPVARAHDGAVCQHRLQRQHVVGGHAVLQRARPSRVVREVPADAAHRLRVGIGRIEEALLLDGVLQLLEHHAGLHNAHHVGARDLEDAVQLLQREHDAAALRQRAAALAGAGAARHHGQPLLARVLQHRHHVVHVASQHHRLRRIAPEAALVALVRGRALSLGDHGRAGEQRGQLGDQAHPNTSTALPVIAKGASAARKRTTSATSRGWISGGNEVFFSISVSTLPGSTTAQKTPCSRPSSASDLTKPVRPHLLALYAAAWGVPSVPEMEPTATMRPRVRRSAGQAALAQRNAPLRFTPSTRSHCASVNSSIGPRSSTPAFSTSTSGGPRWRSTSRKNRATSAELEPSHFWLKTPGGTSGAACEAQTATRAAADPSTSAQARPMPREAPVTTQTLPFRSIQHASHNVRALKSVAPPSPAQPVPGSRAPADFEMAQVVDSASEDERPGSPLLFHGVTVERSDGGAGSDLTHCGPPRDESRRPSAPEARTPGYDWAHDELTNRCRIAEPFRSPLRHTRARAEISRRGGGASWFYRYFGKKSDLYAEAIALSLGEPPASRWQGVSVDFAAADAAQQVI